MPEPNAVYIDSTIMELEECIESFDRHCSEDNSQASRNDNLANSKAHEISFSINKDYLQANSNILLLS